MQLNRDIYLNILDFCSISEYSILSKLCKESNEACKIKEKYFLDYHYEGTAYEIGHRADMQNRDHFLYSFNKKGERHGIFLDYVSTSYACHVDYEPLWLKIYYHGVPISIDKLTNNERILQNIKSVENHDCRKNDPEWIKTCGNDENDDEESWYNIHSKCYYADDKLYYMMYASPRVCHLSEIIIEFYQKNGISLKTMTKVIENILFPDKHYIETCSFYCHYVTFDCGFSRELDYLIEKKKESERHKKKYGIYARRDVQYFYKYDIKIEKDIQKETKKKIEDEEDEKKIKKKRKRNRNRKRNKNKNKKETEKKKEIKTETKKKRKRNRKRNRKRKRNK